MGRLFWATVCREARMEKTQTGRCHFILLLSLLTPASYERSTVGRSFTLRTTVGDLAGAQRLRVQLVLELPHFLLLSAALSRPLPSAHRRWVCCLTLSSKLVGPLERVAQHHHAHTLLVCAHDAARALSSEVTS